MTRPRPNTLACTLRTFFSQHLPTLRGLSPHTIHSYRDSLVLLLRFVAAHRHRAAETLDVDDLSVDAVTAFLAHLERDRHTTASTRNVRLAAIHAFVRFLAAQHPEHLESAQRLLGIPFKRTRPHAVEYLEYGELAAVLAAIDRSTREGRRDYALLATMFNTGARVQEVLELRARDLQLTNPIRCVYWARAARSASARSGPRRRSCSGHGVPSASSTSGPTPSSSSTTEAAP